MNILVDQVKATLGTDYDTARDAFEGIPSRTEMLGHVASQAMGKLTDPVANQLAKLIRIRGLGG